MSSYHGVSNTSTSSVGTAGTPQSRLQESSVSCRNVTVRYGRTVAVDGATFDVRPGEVLGLLGPNGAGKTSLIRALTTILPLSGGAATIAGFDRRYPDLIRGRIGVLPESSGYPAHQTAVEYLTYHGRLYGIMGLAARELGMQLLEDMGLGDRAYSRIRTYSRGMRQRLGIARALINQPEVLFLDEPTLGLDPAGQDEVLKRIRNIVIDRRTTVILTSHMLEEVDRVCDRVVIMSKGRVISEGTVEEVVRQAGVARSVYVRVPPAYVDRAASSLSQIPGIVGIQQVSSSPGEFRVELSDSDGPGTNLVASTFTSSNVPLLSLIVEGATLNEAFLRLTNEVKELQPGRPISVAAGHRQDRHFTTAGQWLQVRSSAIFGSEHGVWRWS